MDSAIPYTSDEFMVSGNYIGLKIWAIDINIDITSIK